MKRLPCSARTGPLPIVAIAATLFISCVFATGLAENLMSLDFTPTSIELVIDEPTASCDRGGQMALDLIIGEGVSDRVSIEVKFNDMPAGVTAFHCLPGGGEEETTSWGYRLDTGVPSESSWRFHASSGAKAGAFDVKITAHLRDPSVLGGEDFVEDHSGILRITVREPPVVDVGAPSVVITSPLDQSTLTQPSASMSGTASDDIAVVSMGYTLNGGPEQVVSISPPITAWAFAVPDLVPGSNTIGVLARDAAGNVGSASVTVVYDVGTAQLACNQMLEKTLGLGERAEHDLDVPAADFVYAYRIESVDLDGSYEFRQDDVVQFGGPAGPGFLYDHLDNRLPGARYTIAIQADNAGGTYRLYLECERPMVLNTNVAVTQSGGLVQLYRFVGPTDPIHVGVHRPQVVNLIAGNVWYAGGTIDLNPVGNPAGGYYTESVVHPIQGPGADHTVLWQVFGASASDVDEYTFAISTVTPPIGLTLNASNSASVNGDIEHLGQLLYYSFPGITGESYAVTLEHPSGSLAAEVVVERMDASSPFYQSPFPPLATGATTRSPAERTTTLGPFVLPADATYTIRVSANGNATYDASLAETMGTFTLVLERQ